MIITIKNVDKELLLNRKVKCDVHINVTRLFEQVSTYRVHIYETIDGVTKLVGNKVTNQSDAVNEFVSCRGLRNMHIRNKRLLITKMDRSNDVLLCADTDIFNDSEYRVVACQMYDYRLDGISESTVKKQQLEEINHFGFKYAYIKAVNFATTIKDYDMECLYNNIVFRENDIELDRLIKMMGQEIIEY